MVENDSVKLTDEAQRNLIKKESPIPYYHQLKTLIISQIKSKNWAPSQKIPSESEFCDFFDVSRTVVRQALKELQNEGYLITKKGKGAFITEPVFIEGLVQNLTGFTEDMQKRGFTVSNTILEQVLVDSDEKIARLLEIKEGAPVVKIRRVRELDGKPAALSTTYVSNELCPELIHEDLTRQSLYYLIEKKYGLRIHRGHRFIGACVADKDIAATLQVRRGSPIITLENVSYLDNSRPIEYFTSYHRGDVSKFEITIHRVADGEK